MTVCLAAASESWAKVEPPGPLHLWRLHGFYITPSGKPIGRVEVTLVHDGVVVEKATTDASGRFSFDHLHGRYTLHIDKSSDYSQLSREVIVGVETATVMRRTLYVMAGPGACSDDCSSVFTTKSDFEKAVRRNTEHHH